MLLCVIPKEYATSRTAVDGVKHAVYSAEEIKILSLTSQALSPRHSSRIPWDKKMFPEALQASKMCYTRCQVITTGTWKWSITVSFRGKISGSVLLFASLLACHKSQSPPRDPLSACCSEQGLRFVEENWGCAALDLQLSPCCSPNQWVFPSSNLIYFSHFLSNARVSAFIILDSLLLMPNSDLFVQ